MIEIPAGPVDLRDEGTGRTWRVDVKPFLLAAHPVTRELYAALRGGRRPVLASGDPRPRVPVTDVSWLDAVRLCNELSAAVGRRPCYTLGDDPDGHDVTCEPDADGYRLPTEAEWEYACRAGTSGERYGDLDATAWHRANSGGGAHNVATRAPNAWGLHDMIGNVWEWCWDVYDPRIYGPYRVFRGGGWQDLPRALRASCRRRSHPAFHIDDLGFRLARSPCPARVEQPAGTPHPDDRTAAAAHRDRHGETTMSTMPSAPDRLVTYDGGTMLVRDGDGLPVTSVQDALDLIGATFGCADTVAVAAHLLTDDFFTLGTGLAGEIMQKFVNYQVRFVIVGDVSAHLARSNALRAFVYESNRGRHVWFTADLDELTRRLGEAAAATGRR
ncbi:DUF4180 domain-containing protein [Catellatospora sichuanensis]|uniref:DUF4180 domain-containing protein n=1 Tax=Catellatospora sichuanensis TaxID=1969805 RepID=UPI001182E945